ncbi:VOC family protein [Rhodococcus sp. X156]|uniref:VOC family protein n=1 Tax=Rhodococcus sp. X156 TaxID=2499145 RepID=UPI0019D2E7F0|nr:VOC family protein [Rhodococcus sp. X156]
MTRRSQPWPEGTPCWFELMVPDLDAARQFYAGVFGWDFRAPEPLAHPTTDTAGPDTSAPAYLLATLDGVPVAGLGELPSAPESPVPAWTTYLAVENVDTTAARVTSSGGVVTTAPTDVPGGRRALAVDPGGARFGLWQAGSLIGAELVGEPGTVCWNEVMTRDYAEVTGFYRRVFGYTTRDLSDDEWVYCSIESNGRTISGVAQLGEDVPLEIPPHWMTYFSSADTDATVAGAAELGARVLNDPVDTAAGRLAVVQGPAGDVFSVVTLVGEPDV